MKTKESILGTIALSIVGAVATKITENYLTISAAMETILLTIFGGIALFSIYKLYKYLQREESQKIEFEKILERNRVWQKYHDIILAKTQLRNMSDPVLVFEQDLGFFTNEERVVLDEYLNEIKGLRTFIKGMNS